MSDQLVTNQTRNRGLERQAIGHVAVCLDRSPIGYQVMPHAVAIAEAFGARLTILHALEIPHDSPPATATDPLDWEVRRIEAQRELDLAKSEYTTVDLTRKPDVESIETQVLEGRPEEVIRDWIISHDVDLTVLATHGSSGRTAWRLASTARKLMEGNRGSVLLVPGRSEALTLDTPVRYDKIMVLLDGSARAECALALTSVLAQTHGSELELLHVVARPEPPCPGRSNDEENDLDDRLVERNIAIAERYLQDVGGRVETNDVRVETQVRVSSDVRGEIQSRLTADNVDLVVASGHGHGGRAQLSMGSVAAFLVERSGVPLLLIRNGWQAVAGIPSDTHSHGGAIRLPQATEE